MKYMKLLFLTALGCIKLDAISSKPVPAEHQHKKLFKDVRVSHENDRPHPAGSLFKRKLNHLLKHGYVTTVDVEHNRLTLHGYHPETHEQKDYKYRLPGMVATNGSHYKLHWTEYDQPDHYYRNVSLSHTFIPKTIERQGHTSQNAYVSGAWE